MSPAELDERRRRTFAAAAERARESLDPETGLIRSRRHPSKDSIHCLAAGFDVRATTEAMTAFAMTACFDEAWAALDFVLSNQDTDRDSLTYGNFKWHSDWPLARDPNAVSFITPHLCYVLKHRGAEAPGDLRERLRAALELALTGLNCHRATWGYTNIALLNLAAKLSIADVLRHKRALALTGWDWEEWRNHTCRLGTICEYNSLTYTAVQIDALSIMLSCEAPEILLREVRAVRRHLLASVLADYHPAVGGVTGPQSRGDYITRGEHYIDTVLHLAIDAPEPRGGCKMWLGQGFDEDDVPPEARNLPLPRTSVVRTHGHCRTNHLGAEFALGSCSGRAHWIGHQTPFFLGWRSESRHCGLPVAPHAHGLVEQHFANHQQRALLAACTWALDRTVAFGEGGRTPERHFGNLSGLNTGRPDVLIAAPGLRPGFELLLGQLEGVRLFALSGAPVPTAPAPVAGRGLLFETDSLAGLLLFRDVNGAGDLRLTGDQGSGWRLVFDGAPEGVNVSPREAVTMAAFLLEVFPHSDGFSLADVDARAAAAELECTPHDARPGWELTGRRLDGTPLRLDVDAAPDLIWSANGLGVTPNAWALGMG